MRNKDFELLAPAGNLEILKGVIESGAVCGRKHVWSQGICQ